MYSTVSSLVAEEATFQMGRGRDGEGGETYGSISGRKTEESMLKYLSLA